MSLLVGAASNVGRYNIGDSLRFRASASAYLNRTFATPTNRKKFTISLWLKLAQDVTETSNTPRIFGCTVSGSEEAYFNFNSSHGIILGSYNGSGTDYGINTVSTLRDPSAWYHIVAVYDTANSTADDRAIIYINGVRQSVTTQGNGMFPLNWENTFNSAIEHRIGRQQSLYGNQYVTEFNFVDGQALAPTDFGETDNNGTWIPKKYIGTYGNNGFYLNFSDGSSVAALGTDSSGNSNTWTVNNVSLTAGATYDLMSDVPTLTNPDVANFATFNGASVSHGTLTNGNLTFSDSSSGETCRPATIAASSGKFYWEVTLTAFPSSADCYIGIADIATLNTSTDFVGERSDSYSYYQSTTQTNSRKVNGASFTETDTTIGAAGAVIQVALDLDAGKIWFGKNNSWIDSGNPSAGTNEAFSSISGTKIPAVTGPGAGVTGTFDINFGQRPFAYTPPTGFKKLNTINLPNSTILDGSKYFDTQLWTGNDANPRSFSDTAFSPDFVWYKSRSNAFYHNLYDSVRGATRTLYSNDTAEEYVNDISGTLKSFDSDGFTVGGDTDVTTVNQSGGTYVGWQWRGSDSTAASNGDGSITSTVSANTTAGFSIVTYAGNSASSATVGHGLGIAPKMVIVKARNLTEGWPTQVDGTYGLRLNSSGANDAANGNVFFANTAPTADVFTVGGSNEVNDGYNYVAYCFAEVEGYSKFSSYTGNGSADGPFIYTGFRPAFVLIKNIDDTHGWQIYDSTRSSFNVVNDMLSPNVANTEYADSSDYKLDFLSNGFKPRTTDAWLNANNQTMIYMAFAENPFKNSNAR